MNFDADAANPPPAERDLASTSPLLEVTDIRKQFEGVRALTNASLDLRAGEIHVLIGENGAGKSTLIKIISGVHAPSGGTLALNGTPFNARTPVAAEEAGIVTIHQEFTLIPTMTVRDNLFLGRSLHRHGIIDRRREAERGRAILERLGIDIDLETPVSHLSVSQQQIVEIGRALLRRAKILIMDEPTAAISPAEVEKQFEILRELKRNELGILFISHRLEEVLAIGDRTTVLRDGRTLGTWNRGELDRGELIRKMVGRSLDQEFPKIPAERGEVRLRASGVAGGKVQPVDLDVRRGEVLGVCGLVGAGRTELARLIAGVDRREAGSIEIDGIPVDPKTPHDAIHAGICLLTEDRKGQGLLLRLTAQENFAIANRDRWSKHGWIDRREERSRFLAYVDKLSIRLSSPDQPAGQLSGGNQQKLILARWLERESRVVIFDEPTRGIDVGAKVEIYNLINDLAAQGVAIVMISSELPEVLGMADRIVVMHEGRVTGTIEDVASATQEQVMELAVA